MHRKNAIKIKLQKQDPFSSQDKRLDPEIRHSDKGHPDTGHLDTYRYYRRIRNLMLRYFKKTRICMCSHNIIYDSRLLNTSQYNNFTS